MIYKTLHRKLKIEQREPHNKSEMNSGMVLCWARVKSFCILSRGTLRHPYNSDLSCFNKYKAT